MAMKKKDVEHFQTLLEERRRELMASAESTREQGLGFEQADLPELPRGGPSNGLHQVHPASHHVADYGERPADLPRSGWPE